MRVIAREFWPAAEYRDPSRPDRYAYAEYDVHAFDPAVAEKFRKLRRTLEQLLDPQSRSRRRPAPNLAAEFQALYQRRDGDAQRLHGYVAPFSDGELDLGRFAFPEELILPLWPWLGMVMDARRWRDDPDEMLQARERYKADCKARGETPDWHAVPPEELRALRQTGWAMEHLQEGGLTADEYNYWSGEL